MHAQQGTSIGAEKKTRGGGSTPTRQRGGAAESTPACRRRKPLGGASQLSRCPAIMWPTRKRRMLPPQQQLRPGGSSSSSASAVTPTLMRPEIDFNRRSRFDAIDWVCSDCGALNKSTRKLVFTLPKFQCVCKRKYLDDHDLVFSLADVRINDVSLLQNVFLQEGPHCAANAMCQMMQMLHRMDSVLRRKAPDCRKLNLKPHNLVKAYSSQYPEFWKQPNEYHRVLKMLQILRRQGIRLEDGSFYKIGDVSYVPGDNYESICEELANGVPLLAAFVPGQGFGALEYGQVYVPPLVADVLKCNDEHKKHPDAEKSLHVSHMVVLLGPAANHETKEQGFFFVNSHGLWCPRSLLIDRPDIVSYGVGKITGSGLMLNAIKLWQPGESAGSSPMRFDEEDESSSGKYNIHKSNYERLIGSHWWKV